MDDLFDSNTLSIPTNDEVVSKEWADLMDPLKAQTKASLKQVQLSVLKDLCNSEAPQYPR